LILEEIGWKLALSAIHLAIKPILIDTIKHIDQLVLLSIQKEYTLILEA